MDFLIIFSIMVPIAFDSAWVQFTFITMLLEVYCMYATFATAFLFILPLSNNFSRPIGHDERSIFCKANHRPEILCHGCIIDWVEKIIERWVVGMCES